MEEVYNSSYTGTQVDNAVDRALNPTNNATANSDKLITSNGVAIVRDNLQEQVNTLKEDTTDNLNEVRDGLQGKITALEEDTTYYFEEVRFDISAIETEIVTMKPSIEHNSSVLNNHATEIVKLDNSIEKIVAKGLYNHKVIIGCRSTTDLVYYQVIINYTSHKSSTNKTDTIVDSLKALYYDLKSVGKDEIIGKYFRGVEFTPNSTVEGWYDAWYSSSQKNIMTLRFFLTYFNGASNGVESTLGVPYESENILNYTEEVTELLGFGDVLTNSDIG